MESIADMKARVRAQEEWGKWNTAPLRNEIARREDELRTPFQRTVRRIGGTLLIVAGCAIAYLPIVLPVVKFFVGG